jgi:hypothetical protein
MKGGSVGIKTKNYGTCPGCKYVGNFYYKSKEKYMMNVEHISPPVQLENLCRGFDIDCNSFWQYFWQHDQYRKIKSMCSQID